MELLLAFLGIGISLGIATWQHRRAQSAENRNEQLVADLPRQLAAQLQKLGRLSPSAAQLVGEQTGISTPKFSTSLGDVDNDGFPELLVQFPVGAHGTGLQVFGMGQFGFQLIGELGVGTPDGFWVEDFDGDGQFEVGTRDTDWTVGLPYVYAPREKIYYRWEGGDFREVGRIKDYTSDELADLRRRAEN